VYSYIALARRLGPDQPVYGLQAKGLDGQSEPLETIEDMARDYVETISAMQSTGPYLLAGWSLGGQIAFEMAHHLIRRGEKVALLVLFDACLVQAEHEINPDSWLAEARTGGDIFHRDSFGYVEHVLHTHLQASARHKPSSYPGRVLLFLASEPDFLSRYRNVDCWRELAANDLELVVVPANHFTMMQEPNIGPVAQRLAASLDWAVKQTRQGA
jgi:thioesterase domain-containing protein